MTELQMQRSMFVATHTDNVDVGGGPAFVPTHAGNVGDMNLTLSVPLVDTSPRRTGLSLSTNVRGGRPGFVQAHTDSGVRGIIETFVLFCEKHGFDFNNHDSVLKVCVLIGLICPDVRGLCAELIPDVPVSWDNISKEHLVFGNNPAIWVHVMQFFMLDADVVDEKVAQTSGFPMPPAFRTFYKLLHQSAISVTHEHAARLFILCNVSQLPMSLVVTHYNKKHNAATSCTPAQVFVGKYVDSRVNFESAPCREAILWALTHLHVSPEFERHVGHYHNHRSAIHNRMQIRIAQVQGGRLRLRNRLAMVSRGGLNPINMFNDSLESWCSRVRLTRNTSEWLKMQLYFLRSQRFDCTEAFYDMVPPDVAKLIVDTPIHEPDMLVIDNMMARLSFKGVPFHDMVEFSRKVFKEGSVYANQFKSMPNPMVFQLYVAAYQPVNWRIHWETIIPSIGMNNIVIAGVEQFVSTHPIAKDFVVKFVKASTRGELQI